MKYILYLFYQYYNKGATKDFPYAKSVFSILGIIILNLFSIFLIFIPNSFKEWNRNNLKAFNKIEHYAITFILVIIFYFIFQYLLPEKKVKESNYQKRKIDKWLLVGYLLLSFILFLFLTFYRK